MVLKLFQGNVVTKIRIGTDKNSEVPTPMQQRQPVMAAIKAATVIAAPTGQTVLTTAKPTVIGLIRKDETVMSPVKRKKAPVARLTESPVKEIRENWDATVKACGTKNAAAEQLGRIYNCSAKNIYAIIYRYSWANI